MRPRFAMSVADVKAVIASLRRIRRFVRRGESREFAAKINAVRYALLDARFPAAPKERADLFAALVRSGDRVLSHADDSDGIIGGEYRGAVADWGTAWCDVSERKPTRLAALVKKEYDDNPIGIKDFIIPAFAKALGDDGLLALRRLFLVDLEALRKRGVGDWHDTWLLSHGLEQVSDCLGDVDTYLEAAALQGRPDVVAFEVACRLFAAGRAAEALAALDQEGDRPHRAAESAELRASILDALGRHDEAQDARWRSFAFKLDPLRFRQFVEHAPEHERAVAEQRAFELAENFSLVLEALHFLMEVGAHERAAKIVLTTTKEIPGHAYDVLGPIAKTLGSEFPVAATVLYRAMVREVLSKSLSKYYPYAIRDFARCERLSHTIQNWQGVPTHAEYIADLRRRHILKTAFCKLMDEKGLG